MNTTVYLKTACPNITDYDRTGGDFGPRFLSRKARPHAFLRFRKTDLFLSQNNALHQEYHISGQHTHHLPAFGIHTAFPDSLQAGEPSLWFLRISIRLTPRIRSTISMAISTAVFTGQIKA